MSLTEIFTTTAGVLAVLFTLIQISPLKIDPWTWIGNAFNKDMNKKVDNISDKVSSIEYDLKKNVADTCRYRILRFSDEIRHGVRHSEEHFDQVLSDITYYKRYCSENPEYKNEKAVNSIELISATYRSCMEKNDF